jgi:uncharacterized protein
MRWRLSGRAIELLGAGTLVATALRYAHAAGDKFKTKPRILFFRKSSGYEHDVVRRTAKGLSLSEATLTEIGRVNGFDVIATKDGRVFDSDLAQYDAFFFFTTGNLTEAGTDNALPMSVQGKEALLAAIRMEKGFSASIRRATHSTRREAALRRSSSQSHISRCLAVSSSATEASKRRV